MRAYWQIVRMAFYYKGSSLLNILFNLLYVIFNLASLLIFVPFLKLIFRNPDEELALIQPDWETMNVFDYIGKWVDYQMNSYVLDNSPEDALLFICILGAILFFLKNVFRYFAMYFLANVRIGVLRDLRREMYHKTLQLPLSYYSEERKGDLMSRLTNDVQEVEVSIMSSLELMFREPFAIAITLGYLFFLSWELTLFSLILLPLSALVIGRISKSLKRSSKKGQDKLGELLSVFEETFSGLKIIKAFNSEGLLVRKFKQVNEQYRKIMIKVYRKRDLASPISELLGTLVMLSLIYFGGSIVLDEIYSQTADGLTGEQFFGFIIVFSQLLRPIQGISNAYANISKGMASVDRINTILKSNERIPEKPDAKSVDGFKSEFTYDNVEFSYQKEPVLKNVSFTLKKGQTIALVGESGGGKSTIADLLPRFYDVKGGQILVDGTPITDVKLNDLRKLMGIVSQRSVLFNDTVFNNIAFGKPGVTEEEIIEAAKIANAHEFISQLENGYDTNIGDGGGKLSGGQQQRISIARAVLNNPPVLILDEATSALDTESEKLVQDALYNLMKNRTTLVIAHRLSTIQNADEILVIKKGEIVERGTHHQLLEVNGVYKKLYEIQSFA